MTLPLAPLSEQGLPTSGRHLLATFDDDSVVIYQAHTHAMADHALAQGRFGGPGFRSARVTRMRTSLPSLLQRCDWGRREGRERILAVHVAREGIDALLRQAVHARYAPDLYPSKRGWQLATRYAQVVVGWHADVDPAGAKLPRETVRLGVRDDALVRLARDWVVRVEDLSPWVRAHREAGPTAELPVPVVRPYPLSEAEARRLAGER